MADMPENVQTSLTKVINQKKQDILIEFPTHRSLSTQLAGWEQAVICISMAFSACFHILPGKTAEMENESKRLHFFPAKHNFSI